MSSRSALVGFPKKPLSFSVLPVTWLSKSSKKQPTVPSSFFVGPMPPWQCATFGGSLRTSGNGAITIPQAPLCSTRLLATTLWRPPVTMIPTPMIRSPSGFDGTFGLLLSCTKLLLNVEPSWGDGASSLFSLSVEMPVKLSLNSEFWIVTPDEFVREYPSVLNSPCTRSRTVLHGWQAPT